ncbi:hypothetical protein ACFQAT_28700 [Undibacterium arcticum]
MMDGQWHRTTVSTSRNAKALKGAYIGNLDGDLANGYIQNFDIGVAEAWFPKGVVISEERRQQFERQAEENRRVRDAELTAEREGVANKLGKKWEALPEAVEHPYLDRKGVAAFGLRIDGDRLVTPIRDAEGKLWSLQYIPSDPDKIKMYEKGGQKTGNFHVLGELAGSQTVLFAEGYATVASLHMATGLPVIEVFDSGNIEAAVRAVKPMLVGQAIIICGDDDVLTQDRITDGLNQLVQNKINGQLQLSGIAKIEIRIDGSEVVLQSNPDCKMWLDFDMVVDGVPRIVGEIVNGKTGHRANVLINNVGREKATQAAEKHGGVSVFPVFSNQSNGLTDFNDLHSVEGLPAVAQQIQTVVERTLKDHSPEQYAKAALGENAILQLPQDNKRYVGPVIANTLGMSVQDIGKLTAVSHDMTKLDRVPAVGMATKITYEAGRGTVTTPHDREGTAKQR